MVQNHVTLGLSSAIGKDSEITFSYMHAFENKVSGGSFFNNLGFGGVGSLVKLLATYNPLQVLSLDEVDESVPP